MINIYTDGACAGNQNEKNLGGWGAILEYGENKKEIFGGEINTTNNRMEMTALLEALRALTKDNLIVHCYSDSSYLMECFNKKWYLKWKNNGWLTSAKSPVENKDLWENLIFQIEKHKEVKFYRVKGHLSIKNNADMDKWFKKFLEWNGKSFTKEDFIHATKMNVEADTLANKGIDSIRNL